MAQRISSSLVTISPISANNASRSKRLDDASVKTLWRAFFTSQKASDSATDRRLEYLFWRIWSSGQLLGQTDVQHLDHLVSRIMASEHFDTSKTKRPESGNSFESTPETKSAAMPVRHTPSKSQPTNTAPGHLHSILKKPSNGQNEPHKSARLLLDKPGGAGICNPSNPPTPNIPEIPSKIGPPVRPSSKRSVFTATRAGRGSRRRPVFNRRRSSQTSIPKAPSPQTVEQKPTSPSDASLDLEPLLGSPPTDPPADKSVKANSTAGKQADPTVVDSELPPEPSPRYTGPFPRPKTYVAESLFPRKPLISREIHTVSERPSAPDKDKHRAEFKDLSPSKSDVIEGTEILGVENAKRIPMPEDMENELLNIIFHSIESPTRTIQLHRSPWFLVAHPRSPLAEQLYLCDWMIEDQPSLVATQSPEKQLVQKEFRKKFQQATGTITGAGQGPMVSSLSLSLASHREQAFPGSSNVKSLIPDSGAHTTSRN